MIKTRTETIVRYVTTDGREFLTKFDAEKHEETLFTFEQKIENAGIKLIKSLDFYSDYEDGIEEVDEYLALVLEDSGLPREDAFRRYSLKELRLRLNSSYEDLVGESHPDFEEFKTLATLTYKLLSEREFLEGESGGET